MSIYKRDNSVARISDSLLPWAWSFSKVSSDPTWARGLRQLGVAVTVFLSSQVIIRGPLVGALNR